MFLYKQLFSAALALMAAFTPTADANIPVTAFAKGPGVVNLSLGDEFAIYQWGLKNDGEFQLTELTRIFDSADDTYGSQGKGSGSVGLPAPVGPGYIESKITNAVSGIDINIRPAWDLYDSDTTTARRNVIVAVIDTGVDITHQEFQNALWVNQGEIPGDGIDNDGNGFVDDVNGWNFYLDSNTIFNGSEDSHGTHAAGTIAAARSFGGIAGITDNAYVKIMPLKALGGAYGSGSAEAVIRAIQYAENHGAVICNLSLGTTQYSEALEQTIRNSKMLFIVAAGNGNSLGVGYDIDTSPVYPASFSSDNIISVANLMFDGSLSSSSNYGQASVDIAAPGSFIVSTIPGGNYGFMSGTSMAAPMVTGVAAMIYSYRSELSLADVKNVIMASSKKLDTLEGKVLSGGMLDAYGALTYGITS